MLRLLTISALLLSLALAQSSCPGSSIDYGDAQECVMAIDADADFNQAGQICSLIGGRLIQTKNQFENIVAGSQLFDVLAGKSTFIGIRRINGTWSYADGTPLTFQKWKSANETNQVGFDCAMMQGNDFSWYSTKCELKWPFICTFPDGRDGNCPNGWKFYQRTSSCYWTPNVNWNLPLNISLYDGEQRCQAQGAHLVSIHSDQENRFVLNLVASVRQNQNVQNCDRKPFNQVLIGLNGTGTEHWTDGSAFDYDHRNSGAYTYGFVNDPLCYQDEWDNWRQDDLFGSYVCKKRAGSQATKRIPIEGMIQRSKLLLGAFRRH